LVSVSNPAIKSFMVGFLVGEGPAAFRKLCLRSRKQPRKRKG
jgi:hypothetical protein